MKIYSKVMVAINIYIASISCIAIFYIIAHLVIIIDNSIGDENNISETITTLLFVSLGISLLSSILSYFITFFIKNWIFYPIVYKKVKMDSIVINRRKRKYDEFIGKISSNFVEIDYTEYLDWLIKDGIIKTNIAHELISSSEKKLKN